MDSFICGSCAAVFRDVAEFLEHKKICLPASFDKASCTAERQQPASVEATVLDADGKSTTFIIINGDVDNNVVSSGGYRDTDTNVNQLCRSSSSSQHTLAIEIMSSASGLMVASSSRASHTALSSSSAAAAAAACYRQCDGNVSNLQTARKRGRPRKSERENPKSLATVTETVSVPEKSSNGSVTCCRCHKLFTKLRQLTSHKCSAVGDYVDGHAMALENCNESLNGKDFSKHGNSVMMSVDQQKLFSDSRDTSDPLLSSPSASQKPGCDAAESLSSGSAEHRQRVPVFQSEEDRLTFDRSLEVDIAPLVVGMYRSEAVEQSAADCSSIPTTRTTVNVFTCLTCSKTFMSLSHCQLHCLIHTTARPFQCPWCDYSTNIRGNLYTHSRHHTGMMFHCVQCSFKTANRSHLTEHKQTHRSDHRTCELCRRDYKTLKSLINHTRKYHAQTSAGADCLSRLQQETRRKKGSLLQYKCGVCSARFPSLVRRDRHLRAHRSANAAADVIVCRLCSKNCDRESYLSAHLKSYHQLVYFCSVCGAFFPSSLLLVSHLNVHQNSSPSSSSSHWSASSTDLFWQSIVKSVFLPQSESSGVSWLTGAADEQMNRHQQNDGLDNILQDVSCHSLPAFSHSDSEILTTVGNSALEYSKEAVEGTAIEHCDVNSHTSSFDVASIDRDVCLMMGYKAMSISVFNHLRQTFGGSECEHCGRLFPVQSDLDTPASGVHTVDRTFTCSHCHHVAPSLDSLRIHIQQLHAQKTYICDTCGTALASRARLWTHRQKAHSAPLQYLCLPCKLTYPTIKRLRIHLEMKHHELTRDQVRSQLAALRTRRAKTDRPIPVCPYCQRVFRNASSDLRRHIWIHEGTKPFECQMCRYACRTRSNLAAHMLRHSADKPFLCNSCGKAYKSRTALRWHERSHINGRIFKCDKCSYEALQLSHLRRHLETHDVQKRFACSHCDYSANTVSYLKIHQTRRHPPSSSATLRIVTPRQTVSTGLQCDICHYRFGNASDLKRHAKLRHGIDYGQPGVSSTATVVNSVSLTAVSSLTPTVDSQVG